MGSKRSTHAMRLRPPSGRPVAGRKPQTPNRRCSRKAGDQATCACLVLAQAADMLASEPSSPEDQENQGWQSFHNGPYQILAVCWQRRAVAQRLGASAASGHLHIPMTRLCYDMQPAEGMSFLVDMPEKTSCTLA